MAFTADEKEKMKLIAIHSIAHGLEFQEPLKVPTQDLPVMLQRHGAAFVTLTIRGKLRGCIGELEARRPLAESVAQNAYNAAFEDPRFPSLTDEEMENLMIHISVLSHPEPMTFTSEEDLLSQIKPGVDGLILEAGYHKGTFLPSVWENVEDKEEFWRELKIKAGLPPDFWSDEVKVSRYHTEEF